MKEKIIALLKKGKTYSEIVDLVGCSKATISYHAEKIGLKKYNKNRYDWVAIQKYHLLGHSIRECVKKFGFNKSTWHVAKKRGVIVARDWKIPLSELLVKDRKTSRTHLKTRLIINGLLKYKCRDCGLEKTWNNKPLSLHLEHINGVYNDNRLENLCLLCPNCHSQTPTFAGKNKGYKIT